MASGQAGLIPWALVFLEHHFPSDPAPFHHDIAQLVQSHDRVAIAAPRGHAKSTLLDLAFALFRAACYREPYILIVSDTGDQAAAHVGNIFEELLENDLLTETYPHLRLPDAADYRKQRVKRTARDFITLGGIRFTGVGAGKSLRGLKKRAQRPTLVIADDLENDESVKTEQQRKKLSNWFFKSLSNLFGAEGGKLIVVGTILHGLALLPALLSNLSYTSRLYRALEVDGPDWTLKSVFENPRPLWAVHWTAETLKKKLIEVGSAAFSSEYMNNPVPPDARKFKREWFKTTTTPAQASAPRVRAWDLAATEAGGDWTVGVLMARDGDRYVIEDIIRVQQSSGAVSKLMRATAERDGVNVRVRIPQDPGQAGKAQAAAIITNLAGFIVEAVQPTGSKAVRATPLAVQAEAGNVEILERPDVEWPIVFKAEVDEFPVGSTDDQVDAAADAFNHLAAHQGFGFAFG